jgi:hypothetical protein
LSFGAAQIDAGELSLDEVGEAEQPGAPNGRQLAVCASGAIVVARLKSAMHQNVRRVDINGRR